MKKIYCIEQYHDGDEPVRDGGFWESIEDPWKIGRFPIVQEYDDEEKFKSDLMALINDGNVISKVFVKNVADDYEPTLKIE